MTPTTTTESLRSIADEAVGQLVQLATRETGCATCAALHRTEAFTLASIIGRCVDYIEAAA